jgi:taurine--2-oxoglutarate transaminase
VTSPPPAAPATTADDVATFADRAFFTWVAQRDAHPMQIAGGSGARFVTADGAEWLDFGSMVWNANLGHGHPAMRRALVAAAERAALVMPSSIFPEKADATRRLLEIAPAGMADQDGPGKVFFCLSGAEANENAIKMARLYTGRRRIVYRSRSYHGATLGMLSFSGDPRRAPFDPGLPDGVPFDDPYSALPHPADLEALFRREGAATIAAVLLEGVVGANGVFVPPRGYFRRVRQICDDAGVLFIADEVLSGFGRTGRWFAVDHDGVAPDLLTCAKGLTGGYAPAGAVLASAKVARFFDDHVLSCGLTAYGHPLSCAAISAAIAAYRDGDLIARAAALGEKLGAALMALGGRRSFVREVRGIGLLWAIELCEPGDGDPGSWPAASGARMKQLPAALAARRLHVHKRDNMVFVAPPLVVSEAELDDGVERLESALVECFA